LNDEVKRTAVPHHELQRALYQLKSLEDFGSPVA
jgi:hypothetical protein